MVEIRNTRQRRAVQAVLDELEGFRSAQEIHEILIENGDTVGLSTVYRNLTALTEAGRIDALRNEEGETIYRRCSSGHHHHLVCTKCGHTIEVDGPVIESWAETIAKEHQFKNISHTFEIFGICQDCAA